MKINLMFHYYNYVALTSISHKKCHLERIMYFYNSGARWSMLVRIEYM